MAAPPIISLTAKGAGSKLFPGTLIRAIVSLFYTIWSETIKLIRSLFIFVCANLGRLLLHVIETVTSYGVTSDRHIGSLGFVSTQSPQLKSTDEEEQIDHTITWSHSLVHRLDTSTSGRKTCDRHWLAWSTLWSRGIYCIVRRGWWQLRLAQWRTAAGVCRDQAPGWRNTDLSKQKNKKNNARRTIVKKNQYLVTLLICKSSIVWLLADLTPASSLKIQALLIDRLLYVTYHYFLSENTIHLLVGFLRYHVILASEIFNVIPRPHNIAKWGQLDCSEGTS